MGKGERKIRYVRVGCSGIKQDSITKKKLPKGYYVLLLFPGQCVLCQAVAGTLTVVFGPTAHGVVNLISGATTVSFGWVIK